jgi:hypothetical protein
LSAQTVDIDVLPSNQPAILHALGERRAQLRFAACDPALKPTTD